MIGSDLRVYRTKLGLRQADFASALDIAQPSYSYIESGRIALSQDHIARLREAFDKPPYEPRFSDFLRELDQAKRAKRGALTGPLARHQTLCVWRFDAFDLSRPPEIDQAVGLVTVHSDRAELVALQMSRKTKHWMKDEIVVFAECDPSEVKESDLCLIQLQPSKGEPQTLVATVTHTSTAKGKLAEFKPVAASGGPVLVGAESVLACFRSIYRARYL